MDNNITIQNTISIGIEIPPETFINEKTINVQNLIIESSSTNNGTICIPDNVSNNIVVPSKKKKIFIFLLSTLTSDRQLNVQTYAMHI